MLNRLDSLRHHAIISSHHEDDYVSRLGTASTHGGKRRVARSIQEGDVAIVVFDMVSTDVLGDTPSLAGSNLGATDIIQQRGLTMVNVTHDGDDGCASDLLTLVGDAFENSCLERVILDQLGRVPHFLDHKGRGFLINRLVDSDRSAHVEHGLDHFSSFDGHLVRKVCH